MSINNHSVQKNAVRHQMSVASHTGLPSGRPKWLVKRSGREKACHR